VDDGNGGSLEEIAAAAALRTLAEQEQALRDLRARAGSLLSASSIVVSFLGSHALDREGLGPFAWLAVITFVASLAATLHVLLPKDGLTFALDGPALYAALWEVRDDPAEIRRRMTYWLAAFRAANQPLLARLDRSFRLASVALVAQVTLWTVQLTSIV
jgi:hypothetical protein